MLYKLNLYISSYLPLYFLLVYKGWDELNKNGTHEIPTKVVLVYFSVLIILIVLGGGTICCFLRKNPDKTEKIQGSFSSTGDNVIIYIMTYLSPMLSIELANFSSLIINLSLFILIGVLYVKNNLIYLNPVLLILGFYIYEWEGNGCKRVIITNMTLSELNASSKEGDYVKARKFENDIWLYKKIKSKK
ncbi:hypothetical protein HRE78_12535 [Enterococcus faecalis]|nr:hypothetical protein [Enterococcus faecalis]